MYLRHKIKLTTDVCKYFINFPSKRRKNYAFVYINHIFSQKKKIILNSFNCIRYIKNLGLIPIIVKHYLSIIYKRAPYLC